LLEIAAAEMHWCIKVDFPEPEIPVRTVRRPIGILAVTFLRLFAVHPVMLRKGWVFLISRREPRVGWMRGLVRARKVGEWTDD